MHTTDYLIAGSSHAALEAMLERGAIRRHSLFGITDEYRHGGFHRHDRRRKGADLLDEDARCRVCRHDLTS